MTGPRPGEGDLEETGQEAHTHTHPVCGMEVDPKESSEKTERSITAVPIDAHPQKYV